MPRPKSELTGSKRIIGARLTEDEFKEWRKLGGSIWLRKFLMEHRKKRLTLENESNKTHGTRSSG
jgi:hypothetical protein